MPSGLPADARVRPTLAEIDLGALRHNLRAVRAQLAGGARWPEVYGVVKADAYGHGAVPCARALQDEGVDGLCVALIEEGLELREHGVTLPILAMSGLHREGVAAAARAELTLCLYDAAQLPALEAYRGEPPLRVHLKVDTGMARLGVQPRELPSVSERLARCPALRVEGLMTHLANADCDDPSFCAEQLRRFREARDVVLGAGLRPTVLHAANSAAAFRLEETRLDRVRVGIALYGCAPFPYDGPGLLPVLRLRTEVIALRELPSGAPVGYGGAYRVGLPSVVATLPIGYADGFFRRLSSEAEVLVKGLRAPVVGNVSMDLCTVDVTHVARLHGVTVGDEVVLLGGQRGPSGTGLIRAEEIAQRVGTIPYEVLTAVSRRVPRRYGGPP
ncbi:MAG: alanine racemase [Deltaproteobacteria bacterium]|nr:alanine racemase [Deltaproteobacteria bacterium]